MKDLAIKIVLSIGLQMVNAGAIYLAIMHMKSVQMGGATPGETLLIVAGLFVLAKTNFQMAKFVKKPIQSSETSTLTTQKS